MDTGTPRVQPNGSDHRDLFLWKRQCSNCNQKLPPRIYPNVELNHWPIDQRRRHTFSQIGNLAKSLILYRIQGNGDLRDNNVTQWHWHNKVEAWDRSNLFWDGGKALRDGGREREKGHKARELDYKVRVLGYMAREWGNMENNGKVMGLDGTELDLANDDEVQELEIQQRILRPRRAKKLNF